MSNSASTNRGRPAGTSTGEDGEPGGRGGIERAGHGQARASAIDLEKTLPAAQLAQAEGQAGAFETASAGPTPANGPSVVVAQKILGRLGYYKGRPDGAASHDLKLAVSAYQRDQGLAATGALDPATVSRLSVFSR